MGNFDEDQLSLIKFQFRLIGMDLGRLNSVGKRSNAELVNGLLGMDLSRLNSAGRR